MKPIGLGNPDAGLIVYIGNRPPLDEFAEISEVRSIRDGEIRRIGDQTGNHWRKIFNCYAKLAFSIDVQGETCWQNLRDKQLLTEGGEQLLLFSVPAFLTGSPEKPKVLGTMPIRIICGKTYFYQHATDLTIEWLDDSFAINKQAGLIISPYFDYRQLSNRKIDKLVELIKIVRG